MLAWLRGGSGKRRGMARKGGGRRPRPGHPETPQKRSKACADPHCFATPCVNICALKSLIAATLHNYLAIKPLRDVPSWLAKHAVLALETAHSASQDGMFRKPKRHISKTGGGGTAFSCIYASKPTAKQTHPPPSRLAPQYATSRLATRGTAAGKAMGSKAARTAYSREAASPAINRT